MKHIGWAVFGLTGYMFWPTEGYTDALAYCEDGAKPVKLYADEAELADHEAAQEDDA